MGVMWLTYNWTGKIDMSTLLSRKLLKVDNVICDILHHICIILTFGLCCPVLAITIATYVSIYGLILVVLIGRFVKIFDSSKDRHQDVEANSDVWVALEMASSSIHVYISSCMWEVVCMSSIFYALLCWDMASDRKYWRNAYWIPITALIIPFAMLLSYNLFQRHYTVSNIEVFYNKELKQSVYKKFSKDVELISNDAHNDNDLDVRDSEMVISPIN
jgi:hypothetical protein